jgi:superfamily II DNA or RNA helicase
MSNTTTNTNTERKQNEYIYIRTHPSYDLHDCCKLGKALNIPDRDSQYATGEIVRGCFIIVYEICSLRASIVERLLQDEFKQYNIRHDGGIEFYNKSIIPLVEPYLSKLGVKYNSLDQKEINELIRAMRIKKLFNRLKSIKKTLIESIKTRGIYISNRVNKNLLKPLYETGIGVNSDNSGGLVDNSLHNIIDSDTDICNNKDNFGGVGCVDGSDECDNGTLIKYVPRTDQEEIINSSIEHFSQYNKGILILTCGVGKTLISLWTAMRLNCNKIIIGVPNKLLMNQWRDIICNLYQGVPYLVVSGAINTNDIILFLKREKEKCIIITTYSSCYKVNYATKLLKCKYKFDMKILDEVHHITSSNINLKFNNKRFIQMLNIPSKKQLSLTATMKLIERPISRGGCDSESGNENISEIHDGFCETFDVDIHTNRECMKSREINNMNKATNNNYTDIISNDDIKHFGKVIERRTLLWAIENNIVCDYDIITLYTNEDKMMEYLIKFNVFEECEKRLLLSAYSSLMSISKGKTNHLLIYSNNTVNAERIIQFINLLLENNYFDIPDLLVSTYHSKMSKHTKKSIIEKFEKSRFGIISCVYCLGEGWDFPLLDGVVFAENMSAQIRIVQSALRACRKNKDIPHKKAKILLPILENDDWMDNNNNADLKKVKEVIYQMGLEDVTITQKIHVVKMKMDDNKQKQKFKQGENIGYDNVSDNEYFGEYDDELTAKLRLKITSRNNLGISYEKARTIISTKNIMSKQAYYDLCDKDNRLTKDPERIYVNQFTNWIYYLSIERKYYEKEKCIEKVNECLNIKPYLKNYYLEPSFIIRELCKIDPLFPPQELWAEYYGVVNLNEIIVINSVVKRRKGGVYL